MIWLRVAIFLYNAFTLYQQKRIITFILLTQLPVKKILTALFLFSASFSEGPMIKIKLADAPKADRRLDAEAYKVW